ncbi:HGxxPAAW family protein [Lipingzhangella sp. LS1_29]|uniref:HGxxPAAW family protein n=1 Tax=Lipingzhangella rawalii TaxID=2055835 RepID=A0ABU2H224_9ACTN|nr:HGxxPAAW family protein [Lipingzhangella rawalii]MDS1269350.1 HGxxPAAW family protein [Lipingzhangella rawalii]
MAEAHHDDHGNTPAAWFLTVSWTVVWSAGAAMIILTEDVLVWSLVTLGVSVVCAVISGVMKKAGLGRKHPRVAPEASEPHSAPSSTAAGVSDEATESGAKPQPVAGS